MIYWPTGMEKFSDILIYHDIGIPRNFNIQWGYNSIEKITGDVPLIWQGVGFGQNEKECDKPRWGTGGNGSIEELSEG